MENKRNCPDCKKDFTYEVPAGYSDNRKYCEPCGTNRKNLWDARNIDNLSKNQPVPVNPEVVKIEPMPEKKEYHLTDEAIRSNALRCTIEYFSTPEVLEEDEFTFWDKVKEFEKYIRGKHE